MVKHEYCTTGTTIVQSVEGRRKTKNIRADPRVALMAIDPQNPYRWIDVRGTVEEMVPDPDYSNINLHAKLYMGVDQYYGEVMPAEMKGTEERLLFKIKPERVVVSPP